MACSQMSRWLSNCRPHVAPDPELQVDVVVAYKIDRITRYLPDFYEFWKVLNQHKVNFVSATQSFDTGTPMGMLMLNMLLSFGQFEREMIAERVPHKIAERAKKGMWNGGWAPFGYTHDPATKQIQPNPTEAPIARRIFELRKQHRSAAKVAATLNGEGLRTPERTVQSRRGNEMVVCGKRFIPNKIKVIVNNPIYKGIIHHNGQDHPGEHEALVSDKLWQEANDALSGKARPGGNPKDSVSNRNAHQTLLKGLIRCGICGHRLTPKPGGKKDKDGSPYLYYTCNDVSKDGKAAACTLRSVISSCRSSEKSDAIQRSSNPPSPPPAKWRMGRDSNPGCRLGHTRFPSVRNRPLCHPSLC